MNELKLQTVINDKYRIDEVLGVGGFGITYKAYDMVLDRYVALKECMPNDFAFRDADNTTVLPKTSSLKNDFEWAKERFVKEAQTLARFRHKNLLTINNIFSANGTVYMDSSMIDGPDLETVCRNKKIFTEDEIRRVIEPLLEALSIVHKEGIMHRDIKPGNIIMKNGTEPVLIDFGSARVSKKQSDKPLTAMVTQGYAPLEQYYEDGNQGAWTDIYAMGGVAYKMLTGNLPPESVSRVRTDTIDDLTSYEGTYEKSLLDFIRSALRMDEKKRPQTSEEALQIIRGEKGIEIKSQPIVGIKDYERGLAYYNRGDYVSAIKCWQDSAKQGNGFASFGLGMCYEAGLGCKADVSKAYGYYKKAADLGVDNASNKVNALYNVANKSKNESKNRTIPILISSIVVLLIGLCLFFSFEKSLTEKIEDFNSHISDFSKNIESNTNLVADFDNLVKEGINIKKAEEIDIIKDIFSFVSNRYCTWHIITKVTEYHMQNNVERGKHLLGIFETIIKTQDLNGLSQDESLKKKVNEFMIKHQRPIVFDIKKKPLTIQEKLKLFVISKFDIQKPGLQMDKVIKLLEEASRDADKISESNKGVRITLYSTAYQPEDVSCSFSNCSIVDILRKLSEVYGYTYEIRNNYILFKMSNITRELKIQEARKKREAEYQRRSEERRLANEKREAELEKRRLEISLKQKEDQRIREENIRQQEINSVQNAIRHDKQLRIDLLDAYSNLSKANNLILSGKAKIREGRGRASAQEYSHNGFGHRGGYGLSASVNNSANIARGRAMIREGESMVEQGEQIKSNINRLSQRVVSECSKTVIKTTKGESFEIVVLQFVNKQLVAVNCSNCKIFKLSKDMLEKTISKGSIEALSKEFN